MVENDLISLGNQGVPNPLRDVLDDYMDREGQFFFISCSYSFNDVQQAFASAGWTISKIGGADIQRDCEFDDDFPDEDAPLKVTVKPYTGHGNHIMLRYEHYDPVFLLPNRNGVGVMMKGFMQELRPVVDILKTLEQTHLPRG